MHKRIQIPLMILVIIHIYNQTYIYCILSRISLKFPIDYALRIFLCFSSHKLSFIKRWRP